MIPMNEKLFQGKKILVVDDELDLREIIASELEYLGASIFLSSSVNDAQEIITSNRIDLVISDVRMPGGSGLDLLAYVKNLESTKISMILISGFADISMEEAFRRGVDGYITKPFQLDEVIDTATKCFIP